MLRNVWGVLRPVDKKVVRIPIQIKGNFVITLDHKSLHEFVPVSLVKLLNTVLQVLRHGIEKGTMLQ